MEFKGNFAMYHNQGGFVIYDTHTSIESLVKE